MIINRYLRCFINKNNLYTTHFGKIYQQFLVNKVTIFNHLARKFNI